MHILEKIGLTIKWRSISTWHRLKRQIREKRTRLPTTGQTVQTYAVDPGASFSKSVELPVIMCTWKRIERLKDTLRMLEQQDGVSTKLYIWNNNLVQLRRINRILRQYRGIPVEVTHSLYNIGGFGRFYYARRLADQYPLVVFIDDDQKIPPSALSTLKAESAESRIVSCWAFTFNGTDNYLNRTDVDAGEDVSYCGTGGMIAPTDVFKNDFLFKACPTQYWFIEDLWLSYVAQHHLGMSLRKSGANIRAEEDGKDQSRRLMPAKSEFLTYLHDAGWNL